MLIGAGKALDTRENAFICINFLGSRYGSTGANSAKFSGKDNKTEFPLVTVTDIIRAQKLVLDALGIKKLKAVIGGSVGGMCALQFAAEFPEMAEKCVAIGACELPAMGLALNHLQREALRIENGVGLARQIAMLSYKSPELFNKQICAKSEPQRRKSAHEFRNIVTTSRVISIIKARFSKIVSTRKPLKSSRKRWIYLNFPTTKYSRIKAETYFVGISSDWLFPSNDVKNLAERCSKNGVKSEFIEMISPDGHDAFLSDTRYDERNFERNFSHEQTRIKHEVRFIEIYSVLLYFS